MTWLTWRQFRAQALVVAVAVVAAVLVLGITGPHLVDLARLDGSVFDHLTRADRRLFYAGIVVLAVAPALLGAFWGAPLVARELEAGTHRLVWSQSITRTRWLATKLGVTALAAAVATGALTLAVTWWSDPIDGAMSETHGSLPARLTPVSFAMRGIAPVGYAVLAVVLGVTLGIVVRRSLAAMALTLAVFTAVQLAVPVWVRPHLITPVAKTVTISGSTLDGITMNGTGDLRLSVRALGTGDWVLSNQTVDADGKAVALPSWMSDCLPPPPGSQPGSPLVSRAPVAGKAALEGCLDRLTAEGYRQRLTYQPADRFWSLQWAETAVFLALSGLLAAVGLWWTRHRLS